VRNNDTGVLDAQEGNPDDDQTNERTRSSYLDVALDHAGTDKDGRE